MAAADCFQAAPEGAAFFNGCERKVATPQLQGSAHIHPFETLTSHAAQPVRIASTAENIVGGSTKYLQLSTIPTICKLKKTQPSAPIACGVLLAMAPRCQARNAANIRYAVQNSPKPR